MLDKMVITDCVLHQVVCQSCSANKCCLEYLKNQLGRVCDQCFPILQLQKSTSYFLLTLFTVQTEYSKSWCLLQQLTVQ